jgi:beta-lactamase regulating signal transducer with metallopeptidase domain
VLTLLEIGVSNAVVACVPAMLAVAVSLTCRRPALVHALWLLVLVKLVTPPLVRVPLPWLAAPAQAESLAQSHPSPAAEPAVPSTEEANVTNELMEAAEEEGAPDESDDPVPPDPVTAPTLGSETPGEESPPAQSFSGTAWPEVVAGVWLAGSLAWLLLAAWRVSRFGQALCQARPAPAELATRVDELARGMGLRCGPQVRLVPGRLSPMVWGVVRPILVLPEGLLGRLNESALDTLVVHELAHLRRRDHWVRVLEFLALGLCWWNPLAWFARRELHEAEEQCCDAWVPRALPGAARTYATALVDVLDFLSEVRPTLPPLACGVGQVHDLKRRLTMILRGTTPHALGRTAALAVLGLAFFLLPLVPGLATAQDSKAEQEKERAGTVLALRALGQAQSDQVREAEAALRAKMAEVEALKKKIADMQKAAREKARTVRETVRAVEIVKARTAREAGKGGVTIRIEISGVPGTAEDIAKLVKDLEKAMPGKDRRVIVLQGGRLHVEPVPAQPGARPAAGAGVRLRVVTPPATPKTPSPAAHRHGMPAAQDTLEKRVDALLRELEALRQELKSRRPGAGARPGPGRPGAGPGGLQPPGPRGGTAPGGPPGATPAEKTP